MIERHFYVYIMTNKRHTVLYTGMTGRGEIRPWEHAKKINPRSFTAQYHVTKLVYAEAFDTPEEAGAAERRIKGWTRKKKIDLVNSVNPGWKDLREEDFTL